MIISGTITLDPAPHAAATAAVRQRLEHLEERRRSAECSVEHVLATWRGEAADLFRTRWEEWNRGALAVIDQLSAALAGLDQVRRDLADVDHQGAQSAVRLSGRLG
jgi:WXG100 family type VII secretion target